MIVHQVTNSYGNYNYNAFVYNDISWYTHFHANYELIYTIEGSTRVIINGETHFLDAGELIFISPYTTHNFSSDADTKTWIGVFSEEFVSSFSRKNRHKRFSKFRCDEGIEKILKERLFYEGEPDRYMLIGCLYLVCNECVKNAQTVDSDRNDEFVHRIIDYISQNLANDITLQGAADFLGYEYHYFSSLFNKCFSMNFKSFLCMVRYEEACQMLLEGGKDVTLICSECGFGSIRNFNRVFKKMSGITPTEYRNMAKE